jgi:tight adherence protein C
MPSFSLSFDFWPLVLSLLAAAAVLSLGGAAVATALGRDPVRRRVQGLTGRAAGGMGDELPAALRRGLVGLLKKLARPALPRQGWQLSQLRNNMLFAGFRSPHAVHVYLGARVAVALALPPAAWLVLADRLQGPLLPLALAGAAAAGFMLPGLWLNSLIRKRRNAIGKELPEVLDLLVIAVEAGLGLDSAVRRVAREVRHSCPVLSGELGQVSLELKAGIPRQQALRNLSARCGVEEISGLVTMLVQADRFGVSVGRSLRVHSDTVRTKRRQKLEEQAAKVPLKLLFPVLFMIFPAIMVVMAGPAIIKVSESILK